MAVSSLVAAGGGVTMKVAEFTTSGTWTAPSNCTAAEVFVVGGGGGGGGIMVAGNNGAAGGGGGGGVVKRIVPITAGASYTVTVGSGGTGAVINGTSSISLSTNGGSSSFGSLITAFGGTGGSTIDSVNVGSNQRHQVPTFGPGAGAAAYAGTSNGHIAGGGGGGSATFIRPVHINNGAYSADNILTTNYNTYPSPVYINRSIQGVPGKTAQTTPSTPALAYVLGNTMGGYGIEGYGGGGGAGIAVGLNSAGIAINAPFLSLGADGGGDGAILDNSTVSISAAGSSATANTGGGGGGGSSRSSDGNTRGGAGGNGAAGYVKIVYWS